ncbi:PepSY-associated TM helix domain-containing protein [Phenylobacterium sp. VNQ135]|uniref:PepSY-associated TM helix domain-containing protein n=1 Tax=Phenylobacterium sp. VNQ135 TaxID=3400922 RepID=UPI003C095514
MRETFRQAMAYMHTWLGLVLGFVLMACFFFGSLSVFDREIDRWSIPESRGAAQPLPSFDRVIAPMIAGVRPDPADLRRAAGEVVGPAPPGEPLQATQVFVSMGHRDSMLNVYTTYDLPNRPRNPNVDHVHAFGHAIIDPRTGKRLPPELEERLALGTGFFFPMHYALTLHWKGVGYWIVGAAGLGMLAALVSGVVMHRRIFREFFTFRPDKARLRSTLDLHNMTGVLALPFLFVITLSGLFIFANIYLPSGQLLMRDWSDAQASASIASTRLAEEAAHRPGGLASVDAMMRQAEARWAAEGVGGRVGAVEVVHLGDANAYVGISRDSVDRVANPETLYFDGDTGRLVYVEPRAGFVEATYDFFYGLHFQFFKHWTLRWLLFASGLTGCACMATGFLFYVEKRKKKHAAAGASGAWVVSALAVTTVTGMLVATGAVMLANRLLPTDLPDHSLMQRLVFWGAWLAALAHALARSRPVAVGRNNPAWAEQCWAAAGLAIAAAVANWVTTGDHLAATVSAGYWPVAGVDLVLIVGGTVAAWAAWRLQRRKADVPAATRPAAYDLQAAE